MAHLESWSVEERNFPAAASVREQLTFLLNYAVLAPSRHNVQPWQFAVGIEHVDVYADLGRVLNVSDPACREMVIACGGAVFNLRMAMRHFGWREEVRAFPSPAEPDLVARVRIAGTAGENLRDHLLFGAITARHTNRRPFDRQPVRRQLVSELTGVARHEGAWAVEVGEAARSAVAELVAGGDRVQMSDGGFRREWADWLRGGDPEQLDGVPCYALAHQGLREVLAPVGAIALRAFERGRGQAAVDRQLVAHAPALLVIGTNADDVESWLAAGQAMEAVLLSATAEGLSTSFFNQPMEVPLLRQQLMHVLNRAGWPQVLLRIGYGGEVRATPRRPLTEVVVGERRQSQQWHDAHRRLMARAAGKE